MSTIAASKKRYYDSLICKSTNKTKMEWNIVKSVTNKRINPNKIVTMNINNYPTNNTVTIINAFSSFFTLLLKILSTNLYIVTTLLTHYYISILTLQNELHH